MLKNYILKEYIPLKKINYIIGISAIVISAVLQNILPKLLGDITDSLAGRSKRVDEIYSLALTYLIVSIALFLMKYLFRRLIMSASRDLECSVRARFFAHLQTLPPKFYNNRKTGDLMAYVINDLSAIRMAFSFGVIFLVEGTLSSVITISLFSGTINLTLAICAVVPLLVYCVFIFKTKGPLRRRFGASQEAFAMVSDKIQENISGIRVVKAYVQEEEEIKNIDKIIKHRFKTFMDYIRLSGLTQVSSSFFLGLSYAITLTIGGLYVRNGTISLGDFVAANTYLGLLANPLRHLSRIVEVWQKAFASISRLDSIFEVTPDETPECVSEPSEPFVGGIEIKSLSFKYPGSDKYALKNIDLSIPSGNILGVIGRTGSGKTTLINLILKLYVITRGKIFIDGMDITDIPASTIRANIGYVPQDNFLFSSAIMDNIKFFSDEYTDLMAEDAARAAYIYHNIMGFPAAFGTLVGERGITLSGGQKQRISIARAIIKEPSILALDDSMSAVDYETEENILVSLKALLKDKTGIIIAHRVSTVMHADEIIVMDEGEIIERGNHDSLIALKGEYYDLYNAQTTEEMNTMRPAYATRGELR